jgi:outer membrane immunogenic protein
VQHFALPSQRPVMAPFLPDSTPKSASMGRAGTQNDQMRSAFVEGVHAMTKRLMTATAAAALLAGLSAPALSADLPRKSPPQTFVQPVPLFTWTGFYVGINGGYSFDNGTSAITGSPGLIATGFAPGGNLKTVGDGFLIGGTVGYNYQIGQFVVGLEGDLSYADLGKSVATVSGPLGTTLSQDMTYFGTVRGRLGVTFDRLLVYGTGGLAFADQKSITTISGLGSTWTGQKDEMRYGYTIGAGAEYAISNNWSAKIEYLYYDLGKSNVVAPLVAGPGAGAGVFGTSSNEARGSIVRAGVNYRF